MRALQVDRLQRDLADGCKGLSSSSPLPMEFHLSENVHTAKTKVCLAYPKFEVHTSFKYDYHTIQNDYPTYM